MAIIKNPLTLIKGGTGTLITKSITSNGTYDAEDDNADGYSKVTVNVAGGSDFNPPFADTRCIKVPVGSLYSATRVSHYLVCGSFNSGAGGYTVGTKFCVYDFVNKRVLFENENYYGYQAVAKINKITSDKYIVVIGRYGYRDVPAIYILDTTNDVWTFYEGQDVPMNQIAVRYSGVSYAGDDFGMYRGDTDTSNEYFVQEDNTCLHAQSGYNGGTYVETKDNEYVYRCWHHNGSSGSYYNNGTYRVARSKIETPNKLYDIKTYNMGTTNPARRFIYQCGRIALLTGLYSTSYYWSLIDMGLSTPAAINMPSISDIYITRSVYNEATNQAFFFQNNKRILMVDINKYLNGEPYTSYCKNYSMTYAQYYDVKIINNKVYAAVGSSSTAVIVGGLYEVSFDNGLVLKVETPNNVSFGIHGTCKENDILLMPSSSQSSASSCFAYIYHPNNDTYDNLIPNQDFTSIFLSIQNPTNNKPVNAFTLNMIDNIYHTPNVNNGVLIYNSKLDTYYVLRTPYQWQQTSSYYKVVNNKFLWGYAYGVEGIAYPNYYNPVLISEDGTWFINLNVNTNNSYQYSAGCYSYNNKDYFLVQNYPSNTYRSYVLCFDETNKTFVVHTTFEHGYIIGSNFGVNGYEPIVCANKAFFTYYQMLNNGTHITNSYLCTTSYSLIFDQTNETWVADNTDNNRFIQIAATNTANKIVYRSNTSGTAVFVYDVANDVATSTGIVPANVQSVKVMPNDMIIIKTTTNLYKYDISTGTSTTLATGSNNSNSNSYGYIYAYKNACLIITAITGVYDSNTDTYTAKTAQTNFYNSNYSKGITTFGTNGMFFWCLRNGYNQTSYYAVFNASNISNFAYTTLSYTFNSYMKQDKLLIAYNVAPSGSVYYSTLSVIKISLSDLTSTTVSQQTNMGLSSSNTVGRVTHNTTNTGEYTFFFSGCYLCYDCEDETFYEGYDTSYLITTNKNTLSVCITAPRIKKSYVFPCRNDGSTLPTGVVAQNNSNTVFSENAAIVYNDNQVSWFMGKWGYSQEELEGE